MIKAMVMGEVGVGSLLDWMNHSCPGVTGGGELQLEAQSGGTLI